MRILIMTSKKQMAITFYIVFKLGICSCALHTFEKVWVVLSFLFASTAFAIHQDKKERAAATLRVRNAYQRLFMEDEVTLEDIFVG